MATKAKLSEIAVGTPTKYKRVKLNVARVVAMYQDGKKVGEIARAIGYKPNTGNNRVRRVLIAAGVYRTA